MSTRSTIGFLQGDGSVKAIYCHLDGYPDGVGKKLKLHYTDLSKIEELLRLGHLSALGEEIGEKQDFKSPIKGMCLAYGRDRGYSDNEASTCLNISSWLAEFDGCDFAYLYANAEWNLIRRKEDGLIHLVKGKEKFTITSNWRDESGNVVSGTKTVTIP